MHICKQDCSHSEMNYSRPLNFSLTLDYIFTIFTMSSGHKNYVHTHTNTHSYVCICS